MNNYTLVKSIALRSRIFIIFLQFFSNILIPDHNAYVFQFLRTETKENWISYYLNFFLKGFIRWDAEYFMQIAKYGYTFENTLAFFPLYPILARIITELIIFIIPSFDLDTALLLVFLLCNIIFFILAAQVLYKVTLLFFDESVAYRTAVLFCFNPASVFFSAPYTESLFSYLTFQSIYNSSLLLKKYSNHNSSFSVNDGKVLLFISLSTLVRSNGLINIGFLVYSIICIFVTYFPKNNSERLKHIVKYFCSIFLCCILCSLPFILYQIYCFRKFCSTYKANFPFEIIDFAVQQDFVLAGQFTKFNQSWCYNNIPLAYSYVQDHYWNVGFLRYYEFKQIPNFLLASPCLYIITKNSLVYLKFNFKKLVHIFNLNEPVADSKKKKMDKFFSLNLCVFNIHALFLSVFCTLFIHVQVSTRMICSSTPLFYWYSVYYCRNKKDTLIKLYFYSYVIIGTVMFCNFLPWT